MIGEGKEPKKQFVILTPPKKMMLWRIVHFSSDKDKWLEPRNDDSKFEISC